MKISCMKAYVYMAVRDNGTCQKKPPERLKEWLHKSEIISDSNYRSTCVSLIVQMHSENIKFIEKLEELIKVMINKEPTLKFMYLVQEIEKLYDLQFKKQNAKDEELKIKETEEQPTIELKAKNANKFYDPATSKSIIEYNNVDDLLAGSNPKQSTEENTGTDNFKDQAKDFEEIKSAKSEDEPDEIDQNKILRNKSNETHNSCTALCKRSLIKDESENDHYSSDNDSTNIKKVNNEIQSDTKEQILSSASQNNDQVKNAEDSESLKIKEDKESTKSVNNSLLSENTSEENLSEHNSTVIDVDKHPEGSEPKNTDPQNNQSQNIQPDGKQVENRSDSDEKSSQQKDGEDDKSIIAGNTSSENMELGSNSHKSSYESKQEQNESNVDLKAKL